MTINEFKVPFYARATIILIGVTAFFALMYVGRSVLVPIVFAMIIAILLSPVVKLLMRLKINRLFAIIITLVLSIIVIAAFGLLLISQASQFSDTLPLLADKFTETLNQAVTWASGYFDISTQKIDDWISLTKNKLINASGAAIGKTIVSAGSLLIVMFLVPVYIFMMLYYQPLLLDFIHKLFGARHQGTVTDLIIQTKSVVQRYLIGLIIEVVIIATLNSVGLLILGIEYAILLGIIGALLNLIPYIGGLVAVAMPMMIALATKPSPITAIYVLIIYYVIQLIDNNLVVPIIVSSKVKINALFSVIAVIVGNALWGVPGMFLSIPLLAIVKLIFDNIEPLKPWGFLLGDTMPPSPLLEIEPIIKKIKKIL